MKNVYLIVVLLTFLTYGANAQADSCKVCKPYPWEIGVPIGVNQYFGDVHCSDPYASQNNVMFGLFARRNFGNYFSLRPQVLYGNLAGNDLDQPDGYWDYRGLKFKSPLLEAALLGELYPFGERKYTCDGVIRKTLAPYLFGGVGMTYTNPTTDIQGPAALIPGLQRLLDEDMANLKNWGVVLPFGLGLKFNASERFALGIEGGYRYSLSDYLDGVSTAGNSGRPDGYFVADVWGSYRFGGKDSDKDGVQNSCDMCPDEPGLRKLQGCPDTDGDGLADKDDECPTQAGPLALRGCPDMDGDGVADKDDACPTVAGSAALKGCPDSDGDGVADKDDACPTVAGSAALNGCPDTDGDGIADKDDACPNQAGAASAKGCPDSDGDGVLDKDDACPNVAGLAAFGGCPDTDGDGIPDNQDQCPDVAGTSAMNGCPQTTAACQCSGSIFRIPTGMAAKSVTRLGTNPEFGNSRGLTPTQFLAKLKSAYRSSSANRVFLDELLRGMGYNGINDLTVDKISESYIPYGTTGNLGFSKAHKTQYSTMNIQRNEDLAAFKISSVNGCDIYFMKVCGNHFYFCPTK